MADSGRDTSLPYIGAAYGQHTAIKRGIKKEWMRHDGHTPLFNASLGPKGRFQSVAEKECIISHSKNFSRFSSQLYATGSRFYDNTASPPLNLSQNSPLGVAKGGAVAPSAAFGNVICGIWQCYLRHLAMQFAANGDTTLLM